VVRSGTVHSSRAAIGIHRCHHRLLQVCLGKANHQARGTAGVPVWQRNYYEHVIRDAEALNRIREYIVTNPLGWALDRENPQRQGEDGFDCWLTSFVAPKP
jgi:REP element-mobilizing transposase RayT